MSVTPRRERRDLSLHEIVSVATEMLGDTDDSALTMRRLGQGCGVTPMAIYNHVDDKETLLTHVVDQVLQPLVDFDAQSLDADEALLEFGSLMRELLLGHRGAATTFLRRPILSATMTRITERFFELVDALDLGSASVAETVDAIVLLTVGSVANDLSRPSEIRTRLVQNEARADAPLLASHVDEYANRDGEVCYRRTLGWIIEAACASKDVTLVERA